MTIKSYLSMKIKSIKCEILDNHYPFIFVHTDEDIIGFGECFRRQPKVTKSVIENILQPALLGKNPLETDKRLIGDNYSVEFGFYTNFERRICDDAE